VLSDAQEKVLRGWVHRWLGFNPSTDRVDDLVGPDLGKKVPSVSVAYDRAKWVVAKALSAETPSLLCRVIHLTDDQTNAELLEIKQRLENEPSLWTVRASNPAVVKAGHPFLDRKYFRTRILPSFREEEGPPICVVEGGLGSGRTYLREYCEGLTALDSEIRVGHSSVSAGAPVDLLGAVAVDIATGLGLTTEPPTHEDHDRWAKDLAEWIAFETPRREHPGLVLLEGFDSTPLAQPFHTFVNTLASRVTAPEALGEPPHMRLRLVLLGYDTTRLRDVGITVSPYVLEHVGADMVQEWLKEQYPGLADFRYRRAAQEVIKGLQDGPTRMRILNGRVRLLMPRFANLAQGAG